MVVLSTILLARNQAMRKFGASLAVLWVLGVGVFVGVSVYELFIPPEYAGAAHPHNIIVYLFGIGFGLMAGTITGAMSMLVPLLLLTAVTKFWRLMAYDDEPLPFEDATLGDLAGVASAFHPRTGALLNVAASVQARAKTSPPPAPVETIIDHERL
jgi:hypothetical protein